MQHKQTKFTLDGGTNVFHIYIKDFPFSVSSACVRAGSKYDPPKYSGLSHLFEHIMFIKTKQFPDRIKRLEKIEKMGFYYNAHTDLENQQYIYSHPTKHMDNAITLLIDGLQNSIMEDGDIEEEKDVIINEERQNYNNPASYLWRIANKGLWKNTCLANDVYGSKNTIKRIDKKIVKDYYDKRFVQSNLTLIFITPINDFSPHVKAIEKHIALQKGMTEKPKIEKFTPHTEKVVFHKRDIQNTHLALTFRSTSINNSKDKYILDFIRDCLAGGWASKLIKKLRVENKLVYWVDGETDYNKEDGYIRFSTSVENNKVDKVISLYKNEIIALKNGLFTKKEIGNYVGKINGDIQRLSINYNWLFNYYSRSASLLGEKEIGPHEYLNILTKISPTDIKEVAQKYFNKDNFSIALVANKNQISSIPDFL